MTIAFKQEYLYRQYNENKESTDEFVTEDIRIDSSRQFSRQASQIHSLLLLLSLFNQKYQDEINMHRPF